MEWRCKRVDGRRSSALGGRGRGADGRARSMSVVVPGTGLLRRPGLDPDLGLMDASVPDCCSQPRVQRAATRSPSAVAVGVGEKGGGCATPGRSKERRRKVRVQNGAQALANMSFLVAVVMGMGDDLCRTDRAWCRGLRISRRVLDGGIGDGWESRFCQREVRLSKTRRGTRHEAHTRHRHWHNEPHEP